MGARVRQVFALEKDARPAGTLLQPDGFVHRRRPSDVLLQQARELGAELRVFPRGEIGAFQLLDRLDERLGDEASTEFTEVAARVRIAPGCQCW